MAVHLVLQNRAVYKATLVCGASDVFTSFHFVCHSSGLDCSLLCQAPVKRVHA